jgi:hypothetical protein
MPIPFPFFLAAFKIWRRVCHAARSSVSFGFIAEGVGHDEDAVPLLRRPHGVSAVHQPADTIAQRGQLLDDEPEGLAIKEAEQSVWILRDHPAWPTVAYNAEKLGPSPAWIAWTKAFTRDASPLAGRAAEHDIDGDDTIACKSFSGNKLV